VLTGPFSVTTTMLVLISPREGVELPAVAENTGPVRLGTGVGVNATDVGISDDDEIIPLLLAIVGRELEGFAVLWP
jgi:hypothetical protein